MNIGFRLGALSLRKGRREGERLLSAQAFHLEFKEEG